jgi:hypothetical protein
MFLVYSMLSVVVFCLCSFLNDHQNQSCLKIYHFVDLTAGKAIIISVGCVKSLY